jgi:hypothetical protein
MKSARRWVIATTRRQLEEQAAELSQAAVQRRVNESESVGITPLPEGAAWWTLR